MDGQNLRLIAFNGYKPGSLGVLFTDATSGVTTYPANRSLEVAAPAADGTVILDFNHAVNLPCAYTEFATCPLPPAGNHLPVAVEAGRSCPASSTPRPATFPRAPCFPAPATGIGPWPWEAFWRTPCGLSRAAEITPL